MRIVGLEKQLKWFKNEFRGLLKVKDRNEIMIDERKEHLEELDGEKITKEDTLKAAKRQNKLMTVSLKKAEQYSVNLELQQAKLGSETNVALKEAVI